MALRPTADGSMSAAAWRPGPIIVEPPNGIAVTAPLAASRSACAVIVRSDGGDVAGTFCPATARS
jgi:hypothetical protein